MSEEARESSDAPRRRLTPIEVQQQVFRRAMLRGYNEQDVDDFLDEVTGELALLLEEQRKLREQLQSGATAPLGGTQDVAEAKRMADDIVRRAREEADQILRAARTQAAAASAGGGGGASTLQPFLSQERAFLQDLSKLIQGHADTVRDMARARRPAPAPEPEPAQAPPPVQETVEVSKPEEDASQGTSVKELFYGED